MILAADLDFLYSAFACMGPNQRLLRLTDAVEDWLPQTPSMVHADAVGMLAGAMVYRHVEAEWEAAPCRFEPHALGRPEPAWTDPEGRGWTMAAVAAAIVRKGVRDMQRLYRGPFTLALHIPDDLPEGSLRQLELMLGHPQIGGVSLVSDRELLEALIAAELPAGRYNGFWSRDRNGLMFSAVRDEQGGVSLTSVQTVGLFGLYHLQLSFFRHFLGEELQVLVDGHFGARPQLALERMWQEAMRMLDEESAVIDYPLLAGEEVHAIPLGTLLIREWLEPVAASLKARLNAMDGARDADAMLLVGDVPDWMARVDPPGSGVRIMNRDVVLRQLVSLVRPAVAVPAAAPHALGYWSRNQDTGEPRFRCLIEKGAPLPASVSYLRYPAQHYSRLISERLLAMHDHLADPIVIRRVVMGPLIDPGPHKPVRLNLTWHADGSIVLSAVDESTQIPVRTVSDTDLYGDQTVISRADIFSMPLNN